jgi:lambda repressor-like predicted transcriptional regulator
MPFVPKEKMSVNSNNGSSLIVDVSETLDSNDSLRSVLRYKVVAYEDLLDAVLSIFTNIFKEIWNSSYSPCGPFQLNQFDPIAYMCGILVSLWGSTQ